MLLHVNVTEKKKRSLPLSAWKVSKNYGKKVPLVKNWLQILTLYFNYKKWICSAFLKKIFISENEDFKNGYGSIDLYLDAFVTFTNKLNFVIKQVI